jgi:hypothetical protein
VEARQRAQLTGTNRSSDLIALVAKARPGGQTAQIGRRTTLGHPSAAIRPGKAGFASVGRQSSEDRRRLSVLRSPPLSSEIRSLPAWWPLQGDQTRSHPELGRQTPQRRWYSVSRHGRVGRRQACQERTSPSSSQSPEPRPRRAATLAGPERQHPRPARPPKQKATQNRTDLEAEKPSQTLGAGWSSPVARQAHNLKAAGSNPAPATKNPPRRTRRFF